MLVAAQHETTADAGGVAHYFESWREQLSTWSTVKCGQEQHWPLPDSLPRGPEYLFYGIGGHPFWSTPLKKNKINPIIAFRKELCMRIFCLLTIFFPGHISAPHKTKLHFSAVPFLNHNITLALFLRGQRWGIEIQVQRMNWKSAFSSWAGKDRICHTVAQKSTKRGHHSTTFVFFSFFLPTHLWLVLKLYLSIDLWSPCLNSVNTEDTTQFGNRWGDMQFDQKSTTTRTSKIVL